MYLYNFYLFLVNFSFIKYVFYEQMALVIFYDLETFPNLIVCM